MFSSFRNRFGIPGVISVIALVFAMFGGAYAASNDSGSATASAKAKKGPRGPRGPQGPAGPQGPKGDTGAAGAKGDSGAAGANGKDGTNGADGAAGAKGATGPTGPTGSTGEQGETGEAGEEGSPWTAGGTLPPGETLKGTWGASAQGAGPAFNPISFPIPLPGVLSDNEPGGPAVRLHFIPVGGTPPAECSGSVDNPGASPGHLCVFAAVMNNVSFLFFVRPISEGQESGQMNPSGTVIGLSASAAGFGHGTFAVTAPTGP